MPENPWGFTLLLAFVVYWFFHNRVKYYFRHPCLANITTTKKRWHDWQAIMLVGIFFIILACCNFVFKTKEVSNVLMVHKYVLVNDGSGSMVDAKEPNGIGNELKAVLGGNEKFFSVLGNRKDGSKDLVGAIVFADDAFIVSYLTDEPEFVHKKLLRIDYRLPPMNGGTHIQAGLWSALSMLLEQDKFFTTTELDKLERRFYGHGLTLKKDAIIEEAITHKANLTGNSLIIFTDGLFSSAEGGSSIMSAFKLLDFCKMCGIRVYFISIFELDKRIADYCKQTGGRGEVIKGYDKKRLEEIYGDIASSQAKEYTVKEDVVDRSLSQYFGLIGLYCVFVGLFVKSMFANYTEV